MHAAELVQLPSSTMLSTLVMVCRKDLWGGV
jgi:hypothetical protein